MRDRAEVSIRLPSEWPHFGCFEGRLCRCMALGASPWPHALLAVRTLFVTVVLLSLARVDCACLGSCAPREVVNATGSFVPPIARRCRMPRDPLGTCTHDSPPVDHCYSASERYPCILCSTWLRMSRVDLVRHAAHVHVHVNCLHVCTCTL